MKIQPLIFAFVLPVLLLGMQARAEPGCAASFSSAANQFTQDGKIVPGSENDKIVQGCKPVFQSMCGDSNAKAQAVNPPPTSGTPKTDIDAQDVDRFCKTMKTE